MDKEEIEALMPEFERWWKKQHFYFVSDAVGYITNWYVFLKERNEKLGLTRPRRGTRKSSN